MLLARLRGSVVLASLLACWMTALATRPAHGEETADDPSPSPASSGTRDAAPAAASTARSSSVAPQAVAPSVATGGDRSAVSMQAISLPQGAGKIGGMGESFSTQLSTGVATGQLELALPAARGSAQPSLALTYSSGNGHGVAGVGWELGAPSITRQTDRGVPTYADPPPGADWTPHQDRFLYGADELVPICLVQGGSCARALPGEVMPEWASGWQYFRSRVEASFARFFWSADHRTWRIQQKSGVTMELGVPLDGSGDAGALESDPGNANRIYRWNLARQYDANGEVNLVVYKYASSDGVAYLQDIFDTPPADNAGATLDRYAHHTRLVYEPRPDATTSYRRGWAARSGLRLRHVDVTSKRFSSDGSEAREQVRRYWASYDPQSHVSLLVSVQLEGKCDPADPVEDASQHLPDGTGCPRMPATTLTYSHSQAFTAGGAPVAPELPGYEAFDQRLHTLAGSPSLSLDGQQADLYDLDGNALPDVLATTTGFGAKDGAFFQGIGGAADRFTAYTVGVAGIGGDSFQNITFANSTVTIQDLDGDGIVDMIHMPQALQYAVYTPTYTASGWLLQGRAVLTSSNQNVKLDFSRNNPDIKAMDVNGDGLVDLVYSTGSNYQTFFSLGRYPGGVDQYGHASWTGATSAAISNDPVQMCVPASSVGIKLSDPDVRVADINGDGLPDLVRLRQGDIKYWPGRGNGLWGTGALDNCPPGTFGLNRQINMTSAPAFTQDASALRLDDVNGDGLPDLVQIRADAIDVWLNVDGVGWTTSRHIVNSTIGAGLNAHVRIADVNGSGTRDILWADGGNYRYVDLMGGERPWLLTHISNGLGRTTDYQYQSSTTLMLAAAQSGTPWQSTTPMPLSVVTRVTESDNLPIAGRPAAAFVTDYVYRDPVYDGRQREFRGFSATRTIRRGDDNSPTAISETSFLLGQCEEEFGGVTSCDAADRWRDNPREALKGLPLLSETLDESGNYLSSLHHTYRLRRLYVGSDGREVRVAFRSASDEYRYDDGPFVAGGDSVTLADVELELSSGVVGSSRRGSYAVRGAGATAHLRQDYVVDLFGNVTDEIDAGCVDGCSGADEVITHHTTPGRPSDDGGGWLWRPVERYISGSVTPGQRHRQIVDYSASGLPTKVTADLRGTLPLDRFHEESTRSVAPPPATASAEGMVVVQTAGYDTFGNLAQQSGAHGRCRTVAYDHAYAALPTVETLKVGSPGEQGCGTTALSTIAAYDRGLGVVTMAVDLHGELTAAVYDGFGRVVELHKPSPTVPGAVTAAPSQKHEYILPVDPVATPYTIVHSQVQNGPDAETAIYADAWAYADGLGRAVVTLQTADPSAGDGGSFIASGLTEYDAKGAARRVFQPWFWTGEPKSFPLGVAPATTFRRTQFDAFGRLLKSYALDGTQDSQHGYHALSDDHWDAADLDAGPHQGTPSSERRDGHGRVVALVERLHVAGQIESHETQTQYLASGEKALIRRVRVGASDAPVVRWIQYDSLGRMVLNVEPDASRGFNPNPASDPAALKAWRYAWSDDGDLVGTSDARGCGENYWYDAGGRLVAEDYSPCLLTQPAYSPPDLATGDGTEVFRRYDSPDADALAIDGFGVDPALCTGRLVETSDRAGKLVHRFDGRGRISGVARRLAKPGPASASLSERYTPHWYTQTVAFDGADRVIAQSSGADVPELLGSDGRSDVTTQYSARGVISHVGGSYGPLVTSVVHDAGGLNTHVAYGDVAQTTTDITYDARRRLGTVITQRGSPAAWSASPPAYSPSPKGADTLQLVLQSVRFGYDSADNPITIEDLRDPGEWPDGAKPASRTMQYDDLYRLTRIDQQYAGGNDAWTSPFAAEDVGWMDPRRASPNPHAMFDSRLQSQSFAYDWLGNTIASDDDSHGFYDRSLGQIGNGAVAAYQLTAASNEALPGAQAHPGHLTARYDDAGELAELIVARRGSCMPLGSVCSQRYAYDWDEVGRLVGARRWDLTDPGTLSTSLPSTAPSAQLRFTYDGDDERVTKTAVDASGAEVHTAYVFESLELRRTTFDGTDYLRSAITEVPYLFAHDVRLARVAYGADDLPSASAGRQHVFLEIADQLGSSAIVIDAATSELVERSTHQAFGGAESDFRPTRWDAFREDHRFTGKEDDVELGLTYFGKRYYAPLLGRWISADPLTIHQLGADLNAYAYVHGRVLYAVDPLGLDDGLRPVVERQAEIESAATSVDMRARFPSVVGQLTSMPRSGVVASAIVDAPPTIVRAYLREGGGLSGVIAAIDEYNPVYSAMTHAYDAVQHFSHGEYRAGAASTFKVAVSSVQAVTLARAGAKMAVGGGGVGGGLTDEAPPPGGAGGAGYVKPGQELVKYDGYTAAKNLLGHEPVTPNGRQIFAHAAGRMVNPPRGRAKMTAAEVDQVLNTADKITKVTSTAKGLTVTVQNTKMPGKPMVIVDHETGNNVITVIKQAVKGGQ